MKVKELIEILQGLPQDLLVVTQDGLDYWNATEVVVVEHNGFDKVLIQ